MFLPIGDDQIKGGVKPIMAYTFIGVNILIFLYQATLGPEGYAGLLLEFGSIPMEIQNGEDLFTLVTNMFLHGDLMHLAGNMLMLWIFGDNIESTVGSINFILFYLMGGIIATMCHALSDFDSLTPAVGASGAIAACLGAYLVMFPKSKIKIMVFYLFRSFKVPAIYFLGFWILKELASGLGLFGGGGNIAYWAHIGGFAFGVMAGYFAKQAYPVDVNMTISDVPSQPGNYV